MKILLLLAAITVSPCAFSQGTLAHIAVGGGWQTSITMLNLGSTGGTASVTLYSDSGAPLVVSASGQSLDSQYQMDLPANGSATLVLTGSSGVVTGWARVGSITGALLQGQAIFHQHTAISDSQAVVPLTPANPLPSSSCIVPLPVASATNAILLPFDNTAGAATGFAIANVLNGSQNVAIEFDDESDSVLATDTITLAALTHTSFTLTDRYPALANRRGVLRVKASAQNISALAFVFNSAGGFATLLPIYQ